MKEKRKKIMTQFNNFIDGIRMLMLIQRNKEDGKVHNPDRASKRKIVINKDEFEKVLTEFLNIKKKSKKTLRIYCSVNKRDLEKGIREFKRLQLEADYYDEKSRHSFYADIRNRFMSALMKPSSRAETYFLIDIDEDDNEEAYKEVLKYYGIKIFLEYKTKNGKHIITEPFNPSLMPEASIKKDALLLLDF